MRKPDPIEKALAEPWLIAPSAVSEIDNWGEPTDAAKQKDALIRELVAALATVRFSRIDYSQRIIAEALAKAKAAGYEP